MQTHDNAIPASSLPDRSGADKAEDRLTEDASAARMPEEIIAFRDWRLRVWQMACEVKDIYSEKLRECNRLLRAGKMTSEEYREGIGVYEETDKACDRLLSEAKKTEAELKEKYGEKYFHNR